MSESKPHILYLTDWYPDRVNPTLGNFIQKHAEAANLYCDISVLHVCPDDKISSNYEIIVERQNGILTIIVYYKKSSGGSFSKLKRYLAAYKLGYKKLVEEKGKPSLMHLNILIKSGIAAYYLKLKYKLKYVYTEHWTGFLMSNPQFKAYSVAGFIYRFIANRSEVIMPVTLNLQKSLEKHGIKRTYKIIANVVDTAIFKPALTKAIESKFHFIHISNALDEHKNISGILRAIEKLKNIRSDFQLKIVSDGLLDSHISYAKELGIFNSLVFFEGTLATAEVAQRLSLSDCLVLFSNYENFPCVIAESMACGVPIISSDVGGITEHLTNEMGIIVDARNDNELTMAMKKMMEQHSQYNPQKLRAYAVKHFSYERIGEELASVYNSAIR